MKKAKQKLKELTSRSQGRNVRVVMYKVKVFIRGWLGYFYIASMRNTMKSWDEWLRRITAHNNCRFLPSETQETAIFFAASACSLWKTTPIYAIIPIQIAK
ncbi:MAG: hypothetical protein II904_01185 [Oscillospiraceae bacterium]|nr:hypothetical protein [Oscillospiraceae bacterium]